MYTDFQPYSWGNSFNNDGFVIKKMISRFWVFKIYNYLRSKELFLKILSDTIILAEYIAMDKFLFYFMIIVN